ncbi:hypothetical protein ACFWDA_25105 [Rhodococcus zopfii]|uniref:hypothetical protein n=1 Tax=Rhodococcus zopfii TaxID=43772 RepID=UPI0036593B58
MERADIDPKDNPEYLTLSQAGKECGVSVTVLRELIQERKLVAGIARTKNGHAYLHRDHVPSWSQIEAILAQMYLQQLARVEKAMKNLEVEVEAVRFDLSEVHVDPDGRLGDDLRAAADLSFDEKGRTVSGAARKLSREVMALISARNHLDDVRSTV